MRRRRSKRANAINSKYPYHRLFPTIISAGTDALVALEEARTGIAIVAHELHGRRDADGSVQSARSEEAMVGGAGVRTPSRGQESMHVRPLRRQYPGVCECVSAQCVSDCQWDRRRDEQINGEGVPEGHRDTTGKCSAQG